LNDNGINYSDSYVWKSTKCLKPYLTYFRHLKHFHESPIVKYSYNSVSYIVFLLLFSYYLLFTFQIPSRGIHWTEIVVIMIVTTMLFEEIQQVKTTKTNKNIIEILFSFSVQTIDR
jgi:hypothetical protein